MKTTNYLKKKCFLTIHLKTFLKTNLNISVVNIGYKNFKAQWANILSKEEISKLKWLRKLIPKEIYHLYESIKNNSLKPHKQ